MNEKYCPRCKSNNIIPIIYGYPTAEMFDDSDNDKCILGGCCISSTEDDPSLKRNHCNDCGFEW